MIRHPLRTFASLVAVALLTAVSARALAAQGSISGLGFGYPVGGGSVRTNGTGGSFMEFDALTPINPAAVGGLTRTVIGAQAEPELRTLTSNGVSENSRLQRIPLIMVVFPARRGVAVSLSTASFLDRTFTTTETGAAQIDGAGVSTSDLTNIRGAINDLRAAVGWQINPRFRVGVGGHIYTGEHQATRERTFSDSLAFGNVLDSSRVTYFGSALSVGGEASLGLGFTVLASYRHGNGIDARVRDTVVSNANIPSRTGLALRYDGIVGSVFAVGLEQTRWSDMRTLGSANSASADARNWHAGAEVSGPRVRGLPLLVRGGYARNQLPFSTVGQIARENRLTAGLGIPVAREAASIDLSVQRATRSMTGSDVKEAAWLLGIGVQIRP